MTRAAAIGVIVMLFAIPLNAEDLSITPRYQETYVWCWVAVGQMVFEHYGVPNVNPAGDYQCGIIGLLAAGTMRHDCAFRCQNCTVPAGSANGVRNMIEEYPRRVAAVGDDDVARLRASYQAAPLSFAAVQRAIDQEHPIIAGISPSGRPSPWASSQHVALIVGYDEGGERLLVNDPYPFAVRNPYVAAGADHNGDGSYWISYSAFRQRLDWAEASS
jgi:Peptidase_C39 like family